MEQRADGPDPTPGTETRRPPNGGATRDAPGADSATGQVMDPEDEAENGTSGWRDDAGGRREGGMERDKSFDERADEATEAPDEGQGQGSADDEQSEPAEK